MTHLQFRLVEVLPYTFGRVLVVFALVVEREQVPNPRISTCISTHTQTARRALNKVNLPWCTR